MEKTLMPLQVSPKLQIVFHKLKRKGMTDEGLLKEMIGLCEAWADMNCDSYDDQDARDRYWASRARHYLEVLETARATGLYK
jgi:hypothetical protein